MTLPEIIARLEQATAPSRELDAEISAATGLLPGFPRPIGRIATYPYVSPATFEAREDGSVDCYITVDGQKHRVERHGAPNWTASVDIALTLVPEGAKNIGWRIGRTVKGEHVATVQAGGPNPDQGQWMFGEATAATPALAFCAAALRARLSTTDQHGGAA